MSRVLPLAIWPLATANSREDTPVAQSASGLRSASSRSRFITQGLPVLAFGSGCEDMIGMSLSCDGWSVETDARVRAGTHRE